MDLTVNEKLSIKKFLDSGGGKGEKIHAEMLIVQDEKCEVTK
jgi:hypothetical protein